MLYSYRMVNSQQHFKASNLQRKVKAHKLPNIQNDNTTGSLERVHAFPSSNLLVPSPLNYPFSRSMQLQNPPPYLIAETADWYVLGDYNLAPQLFICSSFLPDSCSRMHKVIFVSKNCYSMISICTCNLITPPHNMGM